MHCIEWKQIKYIQCKKVVWIISRPEHECINENYLRYYVVFRYGYHRFVVAIWFGDAFIFNTQFDRHNYSLDSSTRILMMSIATLLKILHVHFEFNFRTSNSNFRLLTHFFGWLSGLQLSYRIQYSLSGNCPTYRKIDSVFRVLKIYIFPHILE